MLCQVCNKKDVVERCHEHRLWICRRCHMYRDGRIFNKFGRKRPTQVREKISDSMKKYYTINKMNFRGNQWVELE